MGGQKLLARLARETETGEASFTGLLWSDSLGQTLALRWKPATYWEGGSFAEGCWEPKPSSWSSGRVPNPSIHRGESPSPSIHSPWAK